MQKFLLFFCVVEVFLTVGRVAAATHKDLKSHLLTSPQDLGVFGAKLPGIVKVGHEEERVVCHVYVKSLEGDNFNTIDFQGQLFCESSETGYWNNGGGSHVSMPPIVDKWTPKLSLQSVEHPGSLWFFSIDTLSFPIEEAEDGTKTPWQAEPFFFELKAFPKLSAVDQKFYIRIDDWEAQGFYVFDHYHIPPRDNTTDLQVWVGLKPPFHLNDEMVTQRMLYNVDYHKQLGLTGVIQYASMETLIAMLSNQAVQEHVKCGTLRLVYWDKILACNENGMCGKETRPAAMQQIVHSHMILALKGQNSLLFLVDADEFLFVNQPFESTKELYQGLFKSAGVIYLAPYNIHASQKEHKRSNDWIEYWAENSTFLQHPLEKYDRIMVDALPSKAMVNPNLVKSWFIHDGTTFPGVERIGVGWVEEKEWEADRNPAFVAHVSNLLHHRAEASKHMTAISKFKWVFSKWTTKIC